MRGQKRDARGYVFVSTHCGTRAADAEAGAGNSCAGFLLVPSGVEINPRFYRGKKNSFSMSKTSYCGILVKVWRPHYQSNRRFYADKERRKKRDKKHITFKIPLSVSHRICTEVPQERNLRTLCKQKNVEILEAEACVDHIHMLVSIPPYLSVAQFMGFLKGKSSLMIFDRHANLKYKYGSRNFWCRGYYVDTVGRNKKIIAEHIRNQLEEDYAADQISIKEYVDPFTGDKNKKA